MGSTLFTVSARRPADNVEVRREIQIDDSDLHNRDDILRAALRRDEPWYSNQQIVIKSTRRVDTPDQGSTMNQLHQAALSAVGTAHRLLAQHAGQGCPSCRAYQPTVRALSDSLTNSGYASQSPTAQPVMGGQPFLPPLRDGEGRSPREADRDLLTGALNGRAMSPVEIGRMSHSEQIDQALEIMRRR